MMDLPLHVSTAALGELASHAFDAPSHRPESRSEEARGDAFTTICRQLARDHAEQMGSVFVRWLGEHWNDSDVEWFFSAAWSGDSAETNRARNNLLDRFENDSCEDSTFSDDARIRLEELKDEAAEHEAANEPRV